MLQHFCVTTICGWSALLSVDGHQKRKASASRYMKKKIINKLLYFVYLCAYFFDLLVLIFKLWAHVQRHVFQVTDYRVHLTQVFVHFSFSSIVSNPVRIIPLFTYIYCILIKHFFFVRIFQYRIEYLKKNIYIYSNKHIIIAFLMTIVIKILFPPPVWQPRIKYIIGLWRK